jgi:hypothetical protein
MNLLKTPHQMLMEEAGASPLPSPGMLNTPKQMLFQESGILPKFAKGGNKKLKKAKQNLTPDQMKAAMIVNKQVPPQQFNYAEGSSVQQPVAPELHPVIVDFLKNSGIVK